MLDPTVVDDLIAKYTAHALRDVLLFWDHTPEERAHIIAAIYYLERADND